ncbi:MAG: hypothetical protein RR253_04080 [Oscillospiraceae bacterium]
MNKRLKNQIKTAFTPPPPKNSEDFLRGLNYPKQSIKDLLITQTGYISGYFWGLSALLGLVCFMMIKNSSQAQETMGFLSAAMPFLSLLGMCEVYKSVSYNMAELELSCKHNLMQVTLFRIFIVGGVSSIFLMTMVFLSRNVGFGIYLNALYMTLPFLLTNYIAIYIVNHLKIKDVSLACGVSTVLISALQVVLSERAAVFYSQSVGVYWLIATVIVSLLSVGEILKIKSRAEEIIWS